MPLDDKKSGIRVVVLGYVVRGPLGGMVWSNLQYLMGLAALGHDVWFVEDSDDYASCYDPTRHVTDTDPTYGLKFARMVFDRIGMSQRWSYYDAHAGVWHGPAAEKIKNVLLSADMLIDLCGVNPMRDWFLEMPVRALVDEDPVFTQIRHLSDQAAMGRARSHNAFFTFGENFGKKLCSIPDDGLPWKSTRQPLVLDWIVPSPGHAGGAFSTVMQWDSYPACQYQGRGFGLKSRSFLEYIDLPVHVGAPLEIAVGGASTPRELLISKGWRLADSLEMTRDPWIYQDFISASKGEYSIAKHGYVVSRSGWFSERSVTYLASGRPVVVQDTGFSEWLPIGEGVIGFSSFKEAAAGIEEVGLRYEFHCRRARQLVDEFFDARIVLPKLIDQAFDQARGG
ncbi:MAG: hypothetical protein RLZZ555_140 [Pseudomonadota bacterium]